MTPTEREKEIVERVAQPQAWMFCKLVNKHVTGPLKEGQIMIDGVMGDPISIQVSLTDPAKTERFLVWSKPLYSEGYLLDQIKQLRDERDHLLNAGTFLPTPNPDPMDEVMQSLGAEITNLRTEVSALREDRERLDWLEAQVVSARIGRDPRRSPDRIVTRAAIDAARAQKGTE
jgi:hypothetical protein